MHVSSLDGNFGIGEIGIHARRFIDTLSNMGQSCWQILPVGPTGYGNSPYQSFSSFAGNELLISFDDLAEDGLLQDETAKITAVDNTGFVDYDTVIHNRWQVLDQVAGNFTKLGTKKLKNRFRKFCALQADWLHDYALFRVIKQLHGQNPWHLWPGLLRDRDPGTLKKIEKKFMTELDKYKVLQYLFFRQWKRLKDQANKQNIELIGDLPIFIAHDSADAWCNRELLLLDDQGRCELVAGVPPDYFSETGQRWGNPLYDWQAHQKDNFCWWCKRFDHALGMVNTVRIDHFRGFQAYWEIPANEATAINGRWVKAPGCKLFKHYFKHNPEASFIAEDLGVITKPVEELRDKFDLPGMRVFQFAFDGDKNNLHLPGNYPENCVAYTSTHDNDTLRGWLNSDRPHKSISKMLGISVNQINVAYVIDVVMQSKARTVVLAMQDLLNLDTCYRMNTPSTTHGNWRWRILPGQLDRKTEQKLHEHTVKSNRI